MKISLPSCAIMALRSKVRIARSKSTSPNTANSQPWNRMHKNESFVAWKKKTKLFISFSCRLKSVAGNYVIFIFIWPFIFHLSRVHHYYDWDAWIVLAGHGNWSMCFGYTPWAMWSVVIFLLFSVAMRMSSVRGQSATTDNGGDMNKHTTTPSSR